MTVFRVEYCLSENKNTAHPKQNQRKSKEKQERNLKLYSTTYWSSYCFCYSDRIVYMLTGKSNTIIKTHVLK